MLSIKGVGWKYEKEARIVCERKGNYNIPKNFLKQVCFGMNSDESDITLIEQLIDYSGYSVEHCQIKRTKNDFGIKLAKL